jgi:hypothetical protein
VAAYEALCRDALARFGEPQRGYPAYVMSALCGLGPAECVDPAQLLRWADLAVLKDRRPWQLHALGLAQLRAGRPDMARSALEEGQRLSVDADKSDFCFALAMAHHALGDAQEAAQHLHRGRALIDRLKLSRPGEAVDAGVPAEWIWLNAMWRRAEATLSQPAATPPTTRAMVPNHN